MTDPRRVAHARALMLGSSAFRPSEHLAYLEAHGPHVGQGLGHVTVADLVLRDVALPDEQPELVRVISETLITFGQVGVVLEAGAVNATPARLLAADLVWFGIEYAGRLVGLHGGFFWSDRLWVRRFYSLLDQDGGPWETHFAIESHLYGHLYGLGMREAMIKIGGTSNLESRRATGWVESHRVYLAGNARPFTWLRKAFDFQPLAPAPLTPEIAWQAET
jgi:hypothetical protein